jgi:pimeloyl-ACP methyl ester carboxylesterase
MAVHKKQSHPAILIALSLIAAFAIAGYVYQTIGTYQDKKNYPAPGELVDVDGHKMHMTQAGEGSPSVILDAGTGSFSLMWFSVTDEIAKFSHVCAYDRAGQGWSEESPLPRTAVNMIHELHTLLETTAVPKPYIMVGHSLGGGVAQLYANLYPDDVFGLVLVDAGHEDTAKKVAEHHLAFKRSLTGFTIVHASDKNSEAPSKPFLQRALLKLTSSRWGQKIAEITGIQRLYLQSFYSKPGNAQYEISPTMQARLLAPSTFRTTSQEIAHYGESAAQLAQLENQFAHKPLIVIGNGRGFFYNHLCHRKLTLPEMEFSNEVWFPLQRDLATKSTKGKLIIAQESGHRIQDTEPELIVNAIKELVDEYRSAFTDEGMTRAGNQLLDK